MDLLVKLFLDKNCLSLKELSNEIESASTCAAILPANFSKVS